MQKLFERDRNALSQKVQYNQLSSMLFVMSTSMFMDRSGLQAAVASRNRNIDATGWATCRWYGEFWTVMRTVEGKRRREPSGMT